MKTASAAPVHVVAAVIVDAADRVLVARRAAHRHQGGLWEFPGGKVEAGETARAALSRELREELGIEVEAARPLIRVHHAYPDKTVLLDVWRVSRFRGRPHGREGQPVRWMAAEAMKACDFPDANGPIILAARLPPVYLITPEPGDENLFCARLESAVRAGVRLIQLRAKNLEAAEYQRLARRVIRLCHDAGARVVLNAPPAWAETLGADGVHLTSARLRSLDTRPLPSRLWVAASCHDEAELRQAQRIGVDFAVLAPVLATASHPAARPLGWAALRALSDAAAMPVYALGGMTLDTVNEAHVRGAQGIAAISALWQAAATPAGLVAALRRIDAD